jgi:hypothetical protein
MQNQTDLTNFVRNQAIFQDLSPEELEQVLQALELKEYAPGDDIIHENEISQDIYFIKKGEVEVIKRNATTGQEFRIGRLRQGDIFGEMAFIDGRPRSSSVRVVNSPASVYKFPVNWSNPLLAPLYDKIFEKTIQVGSQRLREINQNYIQNLKQQIKEIEEQNHFGYFFIFMITIYNLYNLARVFLAFDIEESRFISLICFSLLLFLPTVLFVRYMHNSFSEFGLTLRGIKPTLKNTFLIAIGGLCLGGVIYSLWTRNPSLFFTYFGQSLLSFLHWKTLAILFYIFCLEFVIRGTIQTSLQRFFYKRQKTKAILLTALILWPANLYLGFALSLIKFLIDLFLGFIFIKQRNLIGVTLLHFFIVMFTKS